VKKFKNVPETKLPLFRLKGGWRWERLMARNLGAFARILQPFPNDIKHGVMV
jgi:hypothetical protein